MGAMSDYGENKTLDHWLKIASLAVPTNLYVAVSTANPGEDGLGIAEPLNGYARTVCNSWISNGTGSRRNNVDITFPPATGAWGTLTHWAIFDALTGGNMLFYAVLTAPIVIIADETPRFQPGTLIINFD